MLTDRETRIIDLEREAFMLARPKEIEIRERFGISPSSYYKLVAGLIERPDAFSYDPMTVLRLRKTRDQRRRQRMAGSSQP
jgi:hypothetical protein